MKKISLLLLALLCVTSLSSAWSLYEVFYDNEVRFFTVTSNGVMGNCSISKIENSGTDNGTVRAIIWGNEWPEHYHEVIDPDLSTVYRYVSDPHMINLYNHTAEIDVEDADFGTTDHISVSFAYPYND